MVHCCVLHSTYCVCACRSQQDSKKGGARPAIVLDMGLYETPLSMLPSTASCMPSHEAPTTQVSLQLSQSINQWGGSALALQASTQAAQRHSNEWRPQQQQQWHPSVSWNVASLGQRPSNNSSSSVGRTHSSLVGARSYHSGVQASVAEEGSVSNRAGVSCGQLRLYQLVTPDLAGRAVVFGTELALCDTWRCLEPPFFAAPGALRADRLGMHALAWLVVCVRWRRPGFIVCCVGLIMLKFLVLDFWHVLAVVLHGCPQCVSDLQQSVSSRSKNTVQVVPVACFQRPTSLRVCHHDAACMSACRAV
jgi:hypothetical protein